MKLGGFIEFTGMKIDALAVRGYYFSVNSGFSQTIRSGRCIHAFLLFIIKINFVDYNIFVKQFKYFAMKRLLKMFTILTAIVVSSCCKYDDSEIKQKVNALEERVASIETLLKASADNLTVIDIAETEEGVVITFSDNSKVTINKPTEGNSPIVNVEIDGDFVYITLDDGTIISFKKYEIRETQKIYYTTTDGKKIDWDEGNNVLISHKYENGQGILIFENPVTYVGCSGSKTLKSIVIPETVEEVGTFYNSSNLKELYCKAITPPIAPPEKEGSSFPIRQYGFLDKYDTGVYGYYTKIGCVIYVPKGSAETYKSAEWWSRYAGDITEYDFD